MPMMDMVKPQDHYLQKLLLSESEHEQEKKLYYLNRPGGWERLNLALSIVGILIMLEQEAAVEEKQQEHDIHRHKRE